MDEPNGYRAPEDVRVDVEQDLWPRRRPEQSRIGRILRSLESIASAISNSTGVGPGNGRYPRL